MRSTPHLALFTHPDAPYNVLLTPLGGYRGAGERLKNLHGALRQKLRALFLLEPVLAPSVRGTQALIPPDTPLAPPAISLWLPQRYL